MKTASFFHFTGPGRISIARWAPRTIPAGYAVYRALAPGTWFKIVDRETYCRLYAEQLAALDPQAVWDDLHRLAGGHEPVLLCWERLERPDEFCHRRLVADWLRETLGEDVPEMARSEVSSRAAATRDQRRVPCPDQSDLFADPGVKP